MIRRYRDAIAYGLAGALGSFLALAIFGELSIARETRLLMRSAGHDHVAEPTPDS